MARTATKPRAAAPEQPATAQGGVPATVENKHPLAKLREQLTARVSDLRTALPPHITPERFISVVLTAVQNNADLLAADRQSLWNSCMRAAQDGLLPDGREGAIVIYNSKIKVNGQDKWIKKAQWMPMVFGILKKIRNSGQLAMITARVVYGGDRYRYWIDDHGEHVEYEPAEQQDRSVVRTVFAAAKTKDGELLVEVLAPADIERIRGASRSKDKGPWVNWWDQMAIKSAIRRLSKRLPMSSDLDDLVRRDDDLYELNPASAAIGAVAEPRRITSTRAAFDHFAGDAPVNDVDEPVATRADRDPTPAAASASDAHDNDRGAPQADAEADDQGADDGGGYDEAGPSDDAAVDRAEDEPPAADAGAWPADRMPKTEDEYLRYAAAKIAAGTDPDALPAWFRSDAERKLRNGCGVGKEGFDAVQKLVKDRVTALRGG